MSNQDPSIEIVGGGGREVRERKMVWGRGESKERKSPSPVYMMFIPNIPPDLPSQTSQELTHRRKSRVGAKVRFIWLQPLAH